MQKIPYSLEDHLFKDLNEFLTKLFQGQCLRRQLISFKTQEKECFHQLGASYSCSL